VQEQSEQTVSAPASGRLDTTAHRKTNLPMLSAKREKPPADARPRAEPLTFCTARVRIMPHFESYSASDFLHKGFEKIGFSALWLAQSKRTCRGGGDVH
jgi:hypothetical protein